MGDRATGLTGHRSAISPSLAPPRRPPPARPYAVGVPPPPGRKYQPLADSLAAQAADEVALTFAQIETLLRTVLPPSAYLPDWWTAKRASHAASLVWRRVGWEAATVARHDRKWWVTFRRRPSATDDNGAR